MKFILLYRTDGVSVLVAVDDIQTITAQDYGACIVFKSGGCLDVGDGLNRLSKILGGE
tara:strand:+ start:298 stop:471 length:174 start_codon:yes stop_codon:yes gene_type:complete